MRNINEIIGKYQQHVSFNFDEREREFISLKDFAKDLGTEKTLKYKVNRRKRKTKIKIPNELENGQNIVLIKEEKKKNNKYGNLIITIKIK